MEGKEVFFLEMGGLGGWEGVLEERRRGREGLACIDYYLWYESTGAMIDVEYCTVLYIHPSIYLYLCTINVLKLGIKSGLRSISMTERSSGRFINPSILIHIHSINPIHTPPVPPNHVKM